MPLGLIALALGGFGIGLTEFVIAGLLTNIAADLQVSIPAAGYLVSGYALAVVVGALFLTAAIGRMPAKKALLGLMVLFIIGNLLSAWSPNYAVMMAGRMVAALSHGAFFGIGAVLATNLVTPEKKAGAISIMFGGLTLANVLGVPFGTFLGQQLGWRSTFWAISVIGVIAFAGIAALVPNAHAPQQTSLKDELFVFKRVQVWYSIALTVLVFGGMFGAFIYIEPLLTQVSGFAQSSVPWLLVLFGVGLVIGNIMGGRWADKALTPTLVTLMGGLTLSLVLFALTAQSQVMAGVSIFLMGFFGFATVPGLQMRVLNYASDAPTLASAANIAAFNLGNAIGVYLGGLTIGVGLGYVSPLWVGVGLSTAGLLVMGLALNSLKVGNEHRHTEERVTR